MSRPNFTLGADSEFGIAPIVGEDGRTRWSIYDLRNERYVGKTYRAQFRAMDELERLRREHRPPIARFVLTGKTKP